jgi:hypothetical protein
LDSESPQYRRRQYRRPDTFESPDAASSTANSSSATAGGTKPTLRRRTTANNNIGNNKENIGPDGEPLIDFERLAEEIKQQSELPVQMAKRESIIAVASDECKIYFYPDDLVNKSSTEEEKVHNIARYCLVI